MSLKIIDVRIIDIFEDYRCKATYVHAFNNCVIERSKKIIL